MTLHPSRLSPAAVQIVLLILMLLTFVMPWTYSLDTRLMNATFRNYPGWSLPGFLVIVPLVLAGFGTSMLERYFKTQASGFHQIMLVITTIFAVAQVQVWAANPKWGVFAFLLANTLLSAVNVMISRKCGRDAHTP